MYLLILIASANRTILYIILLIYILKAIKLDCNSVPHLVLIPGVELDGGYAAVARQAGAVLGRVSHIVNETVLDKARPYQEVYIYVIVPDVYLRIDVHPPEKLWTGVGNCNFFILKHFQRRSNKL